MFGYFQQQNWSGYQGLIFTVSTNWVGLIFKPVCYESTKCTFMSRLSKGSNFQTWFPIFVSFSFAVKITFLFT